MSATEWIITHGPAQPASPVVLDSPHSGCRFPADFGANLSETDLRSGEDCFVDELFAPATAQGVWLLAALFPRTYVDANRHVGDIDLALLEGGAWPDLYRPSGLAAIGKTLAWRTLDDGRDIYHRKLSVAELRSRIERCHEPYHRALRERINATHQRYGLSVHLDCHSMNAVGALHTAGAPGKPRPDFVVGDIDGSSAAPELTALVANTLRQGGHDVAINDPFKGFELTRAYSQPAAGRHSLQLEINKRLYMDEARVERTAGFGPLQAELTALVAVVNAWALQRC